MKTLADDLTVAARYAVHGAPPAAGCLMEVYAPCCGRRTMADAVLDVRRVPGTVVRAAGVRAPADHDWLCDGCRHRLYADDLNGWTPSRLHSAVGVHPDLVRAMYAHELAEHVETLNHAHRGEHAPAGVYEMILATLPPGVDPHRPPQ